MRVTNQTELRGGFRGSRREFLAAAGVAAAWPLLVHAGSRVREPATWFEWRDVAGGGRAKVALGEGGNSMLLVGKERSLLVDCKTPAFGDVLRREAVAKGPGKLVVINTHHHADHTGGNAGVRSAAEKIIAHAKCKARVEAGDNTDRYRAQLDAAARDIAKSSRPGAKDVLRDAEALAARLPGMKPADFAPTEAISQSTEIEFEDQRVLLRYAGPGHTDNDVFVFLPSLNVLHTGDLLFHKRHPVIDRAGGASTKGWLESLKAMTELCNGDTVVIPGHGEVTSVAGLKTQVAYLETVRDLVGRELDKGGDRAAAERLELPDFAGYGNESFKARALGAVYDELQEERHPAP